MENGEKENKELAKILASEVRSTEARICKVTRVEVIDKNGRVYTNYSVKDIELQLQDDNRTLKIFLE